MVNSEIVLIASFALVIGVVHSLWRVKLAPASFGAANMVTLARNLITAAIVNIIVFDYGVNQGLLIAGLAISALVLDGVDGYIARKLGSASNFGARFDMESDALFMLVLSIGVVTLYDALAWVILIGAIRYLYVAAQYLYQPLNIPLKDRFSRKVVCVVQIIALVLPYTGFLTKHIWEPALLAALAILVMSFSRDVIDQIIESNAQQRAQ